MIKMRKIPHIHELPWSHFVQLAKKGGVYRVTEKIDGSNLSIQIVDDKLYIKTKNGDLCRNPEDFTVLYNKFEEPILLQFRKFLEVCLKIEPRIVEVLKDINKIDLFFEFVPTQKSNVVEYSSVRIGGGCLYLFEHITVKKYARLVEVFLDCGYHIYRAPDLIKEFRSMLNNFKYINERFVEEHNELITSRNKSCKPSRDKLKEAYKKLLLDFRSVLLTKAKDIESHLGATELEGLVVDNREADVIFKIVDLDDFGKRRAEEWADKDLLRGIKKEFFRECVKEVFNDSDILLMKKKQEVLILDSPSDFVVDILHEEMEKEGCIPDLHNYEEQIKVITKRYIEKLLFAKIDKRFAADANYFLLDLNRFEKYSFAYLIEYLIGPKQMQHLFNLKNRL